MYTSEDIFTCDTQGWPLFKMTTKEILTALGGKEQEDGSIIFEKENPVLGKYPVLLEDDGMGYGIHEEYIYGVDISDKGDNTLNIWRDSDTCNIPERCEKCFLHDSYPNCPKHYKPENKVTL